MSDGLKGTILENAAMKPMMILAPGVMSPEHQQMLRDNGLCVVETEKPELVRFVDPIPCGSSRSKIEDAAIALSRKLLNGEWWSNNTKEGCNLSRADFSKWFVEALMIGTPLDKNYVDPAKRYQDIFDDAKADELRRLAREEAKAERAAAKAAKKKS